MKNGSIASIGEFGLIDIIKNQILNSKTEKNVTVGLGDDSFCFKLGKQSLCVTKDLLIENVHFKKEWIMPQTLGQKAIEVNVSDIAAMGNVKPKYTFIGLGVPSTTSEIFIKNLYKGFKKICDKYQILIAGGDTVRADKIVISVTIIGVVCNDGIVKRSGANAGDLIGITNTFGDAGGGVELLCKYGKKHKYTKYERFLISKQNSPKARLHEAWKISKYLTSLTDASDGLYVSIELLTKNFCKGADICIDKIPISTALKRVFKDSQKQLNFMLLGAEDYELVFTVPASEAKILKKLVPQISYIGEVNLSNKVRYFYNGKEQKIQYLGYKHF
ncbi:MAG: thiamine-phosphate kinase [Endomicrobium sp.]|jgi:thiamine-monophosphate kinase|nr:thiamine-phosphate kinase [Endomicrobium sp.]